MKAVVWSFVFLPFVIFGKDVGIDWAGCQWETKGRQSVKGEDILWRIDADGCAVSGGGGAGRSVSTLMTKVTGPRKVSFDCFVQSYGGGFSVYLDAERIYFSDKKTGLHEQWQVGSYAIPAGEHTLKFEYAHPGQGYANQFNGVKLRDLRFSPSITRVLPSVQGSSSDLPKTGSGRFGAGIRLESLLGVQLGSLRKDCNASAVERSVSSELDLRAGKPNMVTISLFVDDASQIVCGLTGVADFMGEHCARRAYGVWKDKLKTSFDGAVISETKDGMVMAFVDKNDAIERAFGVSVGCDELNGWRVSLCAVDISLVKGASKVTEAEIFRENYAAKARREAEESRRVAEKEARVQFEATRQKELADKEDQEEIQKIVNAATGGEQHDFCGFTLGQKSADACSVLGSVSRTYGEKGQMALGYEESVEGVLRKPFRYFDRVKLRFIADRLVRIELSVSDYKGQRFDTDIISAEKSAVDSLLYKKYRCLLRSHKKTELDALTAVAAASLLGPEAFGISSSMSEETKELASGNLLIECLISSDHDWRLSCEDKKLSYDLGAWSRTRAREEKIRKLKYDGKAFGTEQGADVL